MEMPVVLNVEREVIVVGIGQNERPRGKSAAQPDGEEQIVVVDDTVVVAVEVGEVLDDLHHALLKDAEIEVGIDALKFSAKAQIVIAVGPIEIVGELETILTRLLGNAEGGAVLKAGER